MRAAAKTLILLGEWSAIVVAPRGPLKAKVRVYELDVCVLLTTTLRR